MTIGAAEQALRMVEAVDLGQPQLREFIENGSPVYAWPYDRREVWVQRKHRTLGGSGEGLSTDLRLH